MQGKHPRIKHDNCRRPSCALELLLTWPGTIGHQQEALNMVCCGEGVGKFILDVAAAPVYEFSQLLLQGVHLRGQLPEQCDGIACNSSSNSSRQTSRRHQCDKTCALAAVSWMLGCRALNDLTGWWASQAGCLMQRSGELGQVQQSAGCPHTTRRQASYLQSH